ncbi:Holliday junction resolvase RuvX [Candidatus Peregrinibacteria bacterium]|nr:Holliday junction resolvase RuvX [Candidatus Peregrinibacteria bacterium]
MEKGKVLALDYGKKRIGFASGDLEIGIAFPRMVLENKGIDFVLAKIRDICRDLEVKVIVVGLPLSMQEDQRENMILKDVKAFVEKLKEVFNDLEVVLFDERLSSFEAEELMREYKMDGPDDDLAAQIILQRFFDKNKA